MRAIAAACAATFLSMPPVVHGQVTAPQQRTAVELAAIPIAAAASTEELTVRWTPYPDANASVVAPAGAVPSDTFALLERRNVPGALPRQRNPQLSSTQIVAIAVDGSGRELDWQLVPDPRVIRAESAGADGRLSGQVLHRPDARLLLTLPANSPATTIRIYEPSWTGTEFLLRYVGAIALGRPPAR